MNTQLFVQTNSLSSWRARRVEMILSAVLLFILLALRPAPAATIYFAPTGPTGILSAGGHHTCALTPAGAVDCWGVKYSGQADDRPCPYTQVSAGGNHTCALTPAGLSTAGVTSTSSDPLAPTCRVPTYLSRLQNRHPSGRPAGGHQGRADAAIAACRSSATALR